MLKSFSNVYCHARREKELTFTKYLVYAKCAHIYYLIFSPTCCYSSLIITKWGCYDSDRTFLQVTQLISDNARILSLVCLTLNTTVHSITQHRFKCLFHHLLIVQLSKLMNLSEMQLPCLKIKMIICLTLEGCGKDWMSWCT